VDSRAPLILAPVLAWVLRSPNAWLILFFLTALLAPPLPVNFGNSGPHPALAFAALGIVAGAVRLGEWRFRRGMLPGALVMFLVVLGTSMAFAALYSGPEIALQSLARVGWRNFHIRFLYVSAGPGRAGGISPKFMYWWHSGQPHSPVWIFIFNFPRRQDLALSTYGSIAGFTGRAQGLFYEASTLGNFCAFFSVHDRGCPCAGVGNRLILLIGGAIFAAALIFSYSRSSVVNVGVALVTLFILERSPFRPPALVPPDRRALAAVSRSYIRCSQPTRRSTGTGSGIRRRTFSPRRNVS